MTDQPTITPEKVRELLNPLQSEEAICEFSIAHKDAAYTQDERNLIRKAPAIAQAYLDKCESLKKLLELHTELCGKIAWANSLIKENQRLQAIIDKHKWQPIETAPRDGSEILIYGEESGSSEGGQWKNRPCYRVTYYHEYDSDFIIRESDECMFSAITGAHWMPLPEPPKEGI